MRGAGAVETSTICWPSRVYFALTKSNGPDAFNAVKLAKTPVADRLMREYPWTLIKTSGEDVGLPDGTMGNSEVGHQNIGAGRVVPQESLVMTKSCGAGLHTNVAIKTAIERAKSTGKSLHLMGINSDAGVHGLLEHLYAILTACRALDLTKKWARLLEKAEQLKASVRAKVEHPFHVVKNLFRHRKVRYKGMAKNQGQLFALFGLANLVIAKRSLMDLHARGSS